MAARENQGLLIAVIIFVLLSLILALAAFLGISKANQYSDELEQMKTDLASAQDSSQGYQIQSQILQAFIGFKEGGTLTEANQNLTALDNLGERVKEIRDQTYLFQEEYSRDVQRFASNAGGDEQPTNSYKTLLESQNVVLGRQYNDKSVLSNQLSDVEQERDTKLKAKQAQVDEAKKNLATTKKDLDDARIQYETDLKTLQTKIDKIQAENKIINDEKVAIKNTLTNRINNLGEEINGLTREKVTLKKKVDNYEREVFDNPDGRILSVAPEIKMVVVNLGSADGLRANRTFAVYGKQTTNFEKDEHKAKIEITRIVGPHKAEGRITMEDPLDPIIPNDHILTAVWDPGFATEIALSGRFDLDNDGNSDLARLIADIERNGGKVVAYADENGDLVGEINSSTRYFVQGETPEPTDFRNDEEAYENIIGSMRDLEKAATKFSVQTIDTKKLLDWMGVKLSGRIERTDSRIGEGFRRRDPSDR